jgi:transposase-like protein
LTVLRFNKEHFLCRMLGNSSVEEAPIEMYLPGISVRRIEDITEALWGTRVSPSTVSRLKSPGRTQ